MTRRWRLLATWMVVCSLGSCVAQCVEGFDDGANDALEGEDFDPLACGGCDLVPLPSTPGGGGEAAWAHCIDEADTVCVGQRVGDAADPDQARADLADSCPDAADGDVGTYGDGRCPTGGAVSVCSNATGPLESTGEYVEFEVIFYEDACQVHGADAMENTCAYYTGSYSVESPC